MTKIIVIFMVLAAILCLPQNSFAEEKEGLLKKFSDWRQKLFSLKEAVPEKKEAVPAIAKKRPPEKKYTKDEMVNTIKDILDDEEEMLGFMPSMKKETDEKGLAIYRFDGTKLEDLDDVILKKLFNKVRQEVTRIRTDRLNRQLENIRRNQQLTTGAGRTPAQIPAPPPSIPQVHAAPKAPPAPPSQPPQVSRPPSPPPAPPRR